jgi:hypothetical protein
VTPTPTALSTGLVVDNADPGFSSTGPWLVSTQYSGYAGSNYLSDGGLNKGLLTATWLAPIVTGGDYQLQMLFPISDVNTSTSVPVTIQQANGSTITITVNEQANGGTWVVLGTYYFSNIKSQTVQISNAGTTGTVVADAFSWTYVPTGGLPTATPLPIPTPIPGYLAKLPFTFEILDGASATYFNQTATPNQMALVGNDNTAASIFASLTLGTFNWADYSWADAQAQFPSLLTPYHITTFTYDFEHTLTPASEQATPALSVQTACLGAHALGLQYWMTADPGYATAAIEPFAECADVIMLPGAYQEGSPSTYLAALLPWITEARAANPNIKLYAKVDFIHGTPQQDLAALQAVETYVDGIAVTVSDPDLTSNLPTLQALIAQN